MVAVAVGEAGAGHLFADAALLDELLLQAFDEVGQHGVGLVDEGDGYVGHGLVGAHLYGIAVVGRVVVCGHDTACLLVSLSSGPHWGSPLTRR